MIRRAGILTSLLAFAFPVSTTACADDDDVADPDAGTDAGQDAGVDASADDGAGDAAPDGPPAPGDDCDNPIDIVATVEPDAQGARHISGNLDDYADDLVSCGFDNYDGDVVYLFVPPTDGQVRTSIDEGAYVDLAVRTQCDDVETNLSCEGYMGRSCETAPCGHLDSVTAGVPLYLVVDGGFLNARDFTLTVQHYPWVSEGGACAADDPAMACEPDLLCREEAGGSDCRALVCGDGIIEGDVLGPGPSEQCDDGNTTSGDGCSDHCAVDEQGSGGDTCGQAAPFYIVRWNDTFIAPDFTLGTANGDTSDAGADLSGTCAASTTSPDEVYVLTVEEPTPLAITLNSTTEGFLPVLYLVEEGEDGTCSGAELGCNVVEGEAAAYIAIPEVGPGRYYIVVDGSDDAALRAGGFHLEAAYIGF